MGKAISFSTWDLSRVCKKITPKELPQCAGKSPASCQPLTNPLHRLAPFLTQSILFIKEDKVSQHLPLWISRSHYGSQDQTFYNTGLGAEGRGSRDLQSYKEEWCWAKSKSICLGAIVQNFHCVSLLWPWALMKVEILMPALVKYLA